MPPAARLSSCTVSGAARHARQLEFAFAVDDAPDASTRTGGQPPDLALSVPGVAVLPDGRQVSAEWIEPGPGQAVPRSALVVELDPERLEHRRLAVRFPAAGDRFHPLGGPGRRKLTRFLADAGVPREDRTRVPVVVADHELVWVCGMRPAEPVRVGPGTTRRLRLTLHDAAEDGRAGSQALPGEVPLFPELARELASEPAVREAG